MYGDSNYPSYFGESFNLSGADLSYVASGFSESFDNFELNVSSISSTGVISAAPEPSTWALIIVGLGGIGLMLRRATAAIGYRFTEAFVA